MSEAVSYPTQQPLNNASKKSKKSIVVIVVIVIVAIVGILFFRQPKKTEQTTTTPTQESQPSPTEEPTVDKKSVKIQVLNGTGTPGQASKVVTVLEDSGYSSDNIKTDNAEEFSSTITTIDTKSGFTSIADDIKDSLGSTFDEINTNSGTLDTDSEYDIVITTGGKKYEEAETTTTPSPTESSETPTVTPTETPTPTLTPTPTP